MDQVGQRTVADSGRHRGAFLSDPAHPDRDPDVVFGGLLPGVPANVILLSLVHGLFHVLGMDERHQDILDCSCTHHRNSNAIGFALCLRPALFDTSDQELGADPCDNANCRTSDPNRRWCIQPLC